MKKKAQDLSLKVIIIAILALIVLVILVLLFSGKLKVFGSQTAETSSQYSASNCEIPGTNNECMSEDACTARGGAWTAPPEDGFSDCEKFWDDGCCYI